MATERLSMKVLDNKITHIESDVEKHNVFIDGNGQDGAKVRLSALEKAFARIESDIKETKRMVQDMVGYAGIKPDQTLWDKIKERVVISLIVAALMLISSNFSEFLHVLSESLK